MDGTLFLVGEQPYLYQPGDDLRSRVTFNPLERAEAILFPLPAGAIRSRPDAESSSPFRPLRELEKALVVWELGLPTDAVMWILPDLLLTRIPPNSRPACRSLAARTGPATAVAMRVSLTSMSAGLRSSGHVLVLVPRP